MYSYRKSIKSNFSDELINTYVIRPIAGLIVWPLYYTAVTPNQVTIVSIIAGLLAAFFYLKGNPAAIALAGLLVTLKDILDSADGQLARAKQMYSRIGRFLDSIGDFVVDVVVFSAIGLTLYQSSGNLWMILLTLFGFAGITLRVSYHVFYQVNYLHLKNKYLNNRVSEEINEDDLEKGGLELVLQKAFQVIYGWQDKLISRVDLWCSNNKLQMIQNPDLDGYRIIWYSDPIGLRFSGLLGLGTELFLLMLFSVFNELEIYLYLNLFVMNGIMFVSILYRRFFLK